MDDLLEFLKEHNVMCLATGHEEGPHATPVFYALVEDPLELIFLSDPKTRHMKEAEENPQASAGIYLETEKIGLIRGAQIWGKIFLPEDSKEISKIYYRRFPQARLYHLTHPKHCFALLHVDKVRFINNRLGIGDNQEWTLE